MGEEGGVGWASSGWAGGMRGILLLIPPPTCTSHVQLPVHHQIRTPPGYRHLLGHGPRGVSEQHPLALACRPLTLPVRSGCCLELCAQLTPRCSETWASQFGQTVILVYCDANRMCDCCSDYLVDHVLIFVTVILADSFW